jgi:RNA-directed DNA polymerase
MSDALISGNLSPELLKVVERAQREPEGRFHSLAHRIDVPALERAFHRLRKDAAVGVDGVTKGNMGRRLAPISRTSTGV